MEAVMVELGEPKGTIQSRYSAYLDAEAVARNDFRFSRTEGVTAIGTRYYLNKNYKIENGKRVFEKKAVVYASKYLLKIRNEKTDSNLCGLCRWTKRGILYCEFYIGRKQVWKLQRF